MYTWEYAPSAKARPISRTSRAVLHYNYCNDSRNYYNILGALIISHIFQLQILTYEKVGSLSQYEQGSTAAELPKNRKKRTSPLLPVNLENIPINMR